MLEVVVAVVVAAHYNLNFGACSIYSQNLNPQFIYLNNLDVNMIGISFDAIKKIFLQPQPKNSCSSPKVNQPPWRSTLRSTLEKRRRFPLSPKEMNTSSPLASLWHIAFSYKYSLFSIIIVNNNFFKWKSEVLRKITLCVSYSAAAGLSGSE